MKKIEMILSDIRRDIQSRCAQDIFSLIIVELIAGDDLTHACGKGIVRSQNCGLKLTPLYIFLHDNFFIVCKCKFYGVFQLLEGVCLVHTHG